MIFPVLLMAMTANSPGSVFNSCDEFIRRGDAASLDDVAFCSGYFQGLQYGFNLGALDNQKPFVCLPDTYNPSQGMRVYVQFVQNNPQRMHEDEIRLLTDAFRMAFPCPRR
jgi:hypothetical protein